MDVSSAVYGLLHSCSQWHVIVMCVRICRHHTSHCLACWYKITWISTSWLTFQRSKHGRTLRAQHSMHHRLAIFRFLSFSTLAKSPTNNKTEAMAPFQLLLLILASSITSSLCFSSNGRIRTVKSTGTSCSPSSSSTCGVLFMSSRLVPPPVQDAQRLTLRWKLVAKQAAAACTAAFQNNNIRRVSVDIPQISSVDRSTTARKFEDDNNFLLQMISNMGGRNPEPIGKEIKIMMGGFERGGDYLSEEGLYGYRWKAINADTILAIGNAEIDSSALKELKTLDDGSCKVILFNVNLDRLSFFDKIGLPSLDDVETAYVLRRCGPGFLSREYPQDYGLWKFDGGSKKGQPILVDSQSAPYKAQQAETIIRNST